MPVQQQTSSGFLEAKDPKEHSHLERSEAAPVDVLARDDASRRVQGPIDVPGVEVRSGAKSDGTDVRRHAEGDPREASAHKVQFSSGSRGRPVCDGDLHISTLEGVGNGGKGVGAVRVSCRKGRIEGA
jgi:hypothetical protein